MVNINKLNNNEVIYNKINFKGANSSGKDVSISKKSLKIGLAVAATAISATVVGGLLYKKGIGGNNLKKEIKTIKKSLQSTIENQRKNTQFNEFFNPDILQSHIDEASKLGKKEQLSKLKDINLTLNDYRSNTLVNRLYSSSSSVKLFDTSNLPKEVNDAIGAKDQYLATKEYIKYCDKLFEPTQTKGKPVQDSIIEVLGNRSYVKPHTYDMSKEADRIGTVQYTGGSGYIDVTVTSDNMIPDKLNSKTIQLFGSDKYKKIEIIKQRDKNNINSFDLGKGVTEDGKPFVLINYFDEGRKDATNTICLLSPNTELTPAQNDLLKLQKAGSDFSIRDLKHATFGPDKTDFNVILSVIQDLATNVK